MSQNFAKSRKDKSGRIALFIGIFSISLFALVIAIVSVIFILGRNKIERNPVYLDDGRLKIEIVSGDSGDDIAKKLVLSGLIDKPSEYFNEVEAEGAEQKIQAGTYGFDEGTSIQEVVKQFISGPNVSLVKLVIPEGYTVKKCAKAAEEALGIKSDDFIAAAKASNYIDDFPFLSMAKNDSLEGFLWPATYDFTGKDLNADTVIRAMLKAYKMNIEQFDFDAAAKQIKSTYGVDMSIYDFMCMASIIEREAVNDSDRPLVSSVFYNRLKNGMALESDATMGYVVEREVTQADLKQDSPYNTYLNKGLTPTPICAPSAANIKAAMNPDNADYFYFYIIEDGTNSYHKFSKTFEEHEAAIATYHNSIEKKS